MMDKKKKKKNIYLERTSLPSFLYRVDVSRRVSGRFVRSSHRFAWLRFASSFNCFCCLLLLFLLPFRSSSVNSFLERSIFHFVGFHRVLLGFTGFYLVFITVLGHNQKDALQRNTSQTELTGLYLVFKKRNFCNTVKRATGTFDSNRFYWVLPSFHYCSRPHSKRCSSKKHEPNWVYWVVPSFF